jgi:hypothetical protein
VEFVAVTVSKDGFPLTMVVGLATIVTVGGAVEEMVTVAVAVVLPPALVAVAV